MKRIFITLLGLTLSNLSAQQKTHTVIARENLYSISRKYEISIEELVKHNPKIKNGILNIGDVLTIPNNSKSGVSKNSGTKNPSQKLGKIILQPKQTIYGITKQYKISEAELRRLNPDLDNHMKIGDAVILPEENIKKYGDVLAQNNPTSPSPKEEIKNNSASNNVIPYTIQPKDTYYGISKKFNLSQQELLTLNPYLAQKGLQPGDVIKVKGIPLKAPQSNPITKTNTYSVEEYVTHKVQKGDSVFEIINKYNISYQQLSELNNGLKEGLKEGTELKIKKYERQYISVENDVFNVALMLPFGYDSNDNRYRNLATDFLLGAKLAIERNVLQGKKISLNVIDAENENSFKNSLSQINKTNTNLIIGPFFKSNVLEVLDYVKNEKIPVVAPFAHTSDLYDYSNLVLIETHSRVYAERIAKEVEQVYANQKIYLIGDKNNDDVTFLKNHLGRNLSKANITIINSPNEISLEQNMMTGLKVPAIIILASNDEQIGKSFAQKLTSLGKETEGIRAFSMYYHPDFEKNVNDLIPSNLVYLMDRKINTNGNFEKEILANFRKKYCKTPSKYTIIGFDVMNDMLTREYNGDVLRQMDKTQTQLATKFEYIRAKKNGAFVNTGYRVVRLIP